MKIKIARAELLTRLQRVQGIVEKRNTMPVLSNISWKRSWPGSSRWRRTSRSPSEGIS